MTLSDYIGIASLVVSILGFGYTLRQVSKTKSAAEAAEQAATQMKDHLRNLDSVMDFTTAISIVDEIKRHQRGNNWVILPDRYSLLRAKLIAIKTSCTSLSEEHQAFLQGSITQFKSVESKIDGALASSSQPDFAKLNKLISNELDGLHEILIELRNKIG